MSEAVDPCRAAYDAWLRQEFGWTQQQVENSIWQPFREVWQAAYEAGRRAEQDQLKATGPKGWLTPLERHFIERDRDEWKEACQRQYQRANAAEEALRRGAKPCSRSDS